MIQGQIIPTNTFYSNLNRTRTSQTSFADESNRSLTVVSSIAELSLLCYDEGDGLKHLAAQTAGQPLQRGQVLDLQVVRGDVAVSHCALMEFTEELLEDVVDADACQETALLNAAVQRLGDESFVTGRTKEESKSFLSAFYTNE